MEMDPKRNAEHYPDPTAYEAIRNVEPARFPFRPLVYVCSPYAGAIEDNVMKARRYCRYVTDQGGIPLAPHLFALVLSSKWDCSWTAMASLWRIVFTAAIRMNKLHYSPWKKRLYMTSTYLASSSVLTEASPLFPTGNSIPVGNAPL